MSVATSFIPGTLVKFMVEKETESGQKQTQIFSYCDNRLR